MLIGVLFALLAGLMWGLIFVAPLLVDGYPPAPVSYTHLTLPTKA